MYRAEVRRIHQDIHGRRAYEAVMTCQRVEGRLVENESPDVVQHAASRPRHPRRGYRRAGQSRKAQENTSCLWTETRRRALRGHRKHRGVHYELMFIKSDVTPCSDSRQSPSRWAKDIRPRHTQSDRSSAPGAFRPVMWILRSTRSDNRHQHDRAAQVEAIAKADNHRASLRAPAGRRSWRDSFSRGRTFARGHRIGQCVTRRCRR